MGEILIATLGTAPQVVTLVLDKLLERGHMISKAIVLHMSTRTPRVQEAVAALHQEVQHYRERGVELRLEAFRDAEQLEVIDTKHERDAEVVRLVLFQQVQAQKLEGRKVHLSIAGGRKTMSAYGLVAAQMLFGADDCCWHLLSEDGVVNDGRLHPEKGDDIALVPVKVLRWGDLSFDALALARSSDPFAVVQSAETRRRRLRARLREFLVLLTPAEKMVFELMVREGLEPAAIANRLVTAERTIQNHRTHIRDKFRDFSAEPSAGYERIIAHFAPAADEPESGE